MEQRVRRCGGFGLHGQRLMARTHPRKPSRGGALNLRGRSGSFCPNSGRTGHQCPLVVVGVRRHAGVPGGGSPHPDLHDGAWSASGRQVAGSGLAGPARPGGVRGPGMDFQRSVAGRHPRHSLLEIALRGNSARPIAARTQSNPARAHRSLVEFQKPDNAIGPGGLRL